MEGILSKRFYSVYSNTFLVTQRVELILQRKILRWDLRDSYLFSHACVYDITAKSQGDLGHVLHDRLQMELNRKFLKRKETKP